MSRLPRPTIPRSVRLTVVLRQLSAMTPAEVDAYVANAGGQRMLGRMLVSLLPQLAVKLAGSRAAKLHLDHEPALENRQRYADVTGIHYDPDANDPNHLVYRTVHEHYIKTHVRGDGAQFSDTALAKRERRRQKKKTAKVRKIESANRWPPKGSRKINNQSTPKSKRPDFRGA